MAQYQVLQQRHQTTQLREMLFAELFDALLTQIVASPNAKETPCMAISGSTSSTPGAGTRTVVVMGVAGCGKTTVAGELVDRTGWVFAEGDDFHPSANVAKLRAGHPLDDDDRWPWLRAIATWIGAHERSGTSAVVTCSALKRSYRDLLREGHDSVWFGYLAVPATVLSDRLRCRRGHYMPASLLESQLAALEPLGDDEPGVTAIGHAPAPEVAAEVLKALRGDHSGELPPSAGSTPSGAAHACGAVEPPGSTS